VTLRTGAILRVACGVKRDACPIRRNFGPVALCDFFRVRTVDVGNEDLSDAIVCDFPFRGVNELGQRDAKTDGDNE
jgi:hypothetical protein